MSDMENKQPETEEETGMETETPTEAEQLNESEPKTKKMRLHSRILLIVGIAVLAVLLIGGSIILSTLRQLRGDEHVPIVERESEYVMPSMEAELVTLSPEDLETLEDIYDETIPLEIETLPVTETEIFTETTAGKTEAGNNPVKNPTTGTTTSTQRKPIPIYKQEKKDQDVLNILLLGRDARNPSVEYGRTDTMIVLSYNKKTHDVKMVSLMRDTFIPIEGHDWNRINTAYAYGGIGLCINTVNDVFQLDIQDYVTIDFNGLVSVINAIGGVDVNLTPDEVVYYQEKGTLAKDAKAGINHLNGKQALAHARNRSLGSDFERTRRQRDILQAVFNRVTSSMTLTEVTDLITSTLKMVSTNLSASNLLSLATDVMANRKDISITSGRVPFNGTYEGMIYPKDGYRMWVISIDIAENVKQLHKLLYD